MDQNPVIPNLFKFHRKAGLSSDVEKLYKGTWIEGDPGLGLCPNVHLAQCFQDLSQHTTNIGFIDYQTRQVLNTDFEPGNPDFCHQVLGLDQCPSLTTNRPSDLGTDIAFILFLTTFVLPFIFKTIRSIRFLPLSNTRIGKKNYPIVYGIFFFLAWCVALGAPNWNIFALLRALIQKHANSE